MEVKIRTLFCCIFSCSILLLYILSINNMGIDAASASKSSEPTETKNSWSLNGHVASNSMNDKPYFDETNTKNVTAIAENVAILKCRVKNKKNRTVSWMRKRDLHILTTNIYTYTGDQRFSVIHPPGSDDYDLRIKSTQLRDTGIYECQVNTEPKMNLAIHLQITDEPIHPNNKQVVPFYYDIKAARAQILGNTEIHVKKDSTISLACSVNIHAQSVIWYHGNKVIDFDSSRGGISLETEKTESGTTSRLLLTRATVRDSGNYTCAPKSAIPASASVHVLNDEHPAGLTTSIAANMKNNFILNLFFTIFGLLYWNSRINIYMAICRVDSH
ncbi:hypothetical protein ACFFRR_001676 [Megaselia abdita]